MADGVEIVVMVDAGRSRGLMAVAIITDGGVYHNNIVVAERSRWGLIMHVEELNKNLEAPESYHSESEL